MNDSRFLVSGWDDDLEDVDEGRNPQGIIYLNGINYLHINQRVI